MDSIINYMDETEVKLIKKFFDVDLANTYNSGVKHIYVGESNFYNICDFYSFECKNEETDFFNKIEQLKLLLTDKIIKLYVNRVDHLGYYWYDYITKIDLKFDVIAKHLIINYDKTSDLYDWVLYNICIRIFLTDFNKDYPDIDTTLAKKINHNHIVEVLNKLLNK